MTSAAESKVAGTNPYILLVDDSRDGREMLAEYLRFGAFRVVEAMSGEAAIAQARASHPTLVLMDLQMPGLNGWDATCQLKADPHTRDVIIVALTADALAHDQVIARQAGCDAFVAKPFDIVAVGDAIENVMNHGRRGLPHSKRYPVHRLLAAAVKSTVVADENLTVGSAVWLPAESIAPGR
jgi:two-component system cell cycle response regulator DivK